MEMEDKLKALIAGGATAAELASIRDGWDPECLTEGTWLHAAVRRGLLPLIAGGATAAELASFRGEYECSALCVAASKCLEHVKGGVTADDLKKDVHAGRSSLFFAVLRGQAKYITGPIKKGSLTKAELSEAVRQQCGDIFSHLDGPTLQLLMSLGASQQSLRGYISRCRKKLRLAVQNNSDAKELYFERLRTLTAVAEKSGMRIRHPADIVALLL